MAPGLRLLIRPREKNWENNYETADFCEGFIRRQAGQDVRHGADFGPQVCINVNCAWLIADSAAMADVSPARGRAWL